MGNSGWTADPNDLTIPPDGAPPNQFIYIGDNDPLFDVDGADGGIAFHFGEAYGFVLGVDQVTPEAGFVYLDAVNALTAQFAILVEAFYDASTNFSQLSLGDPGADVRINADRIEMTAQDKVNIASGSNLCYADRSLGRGIVQSVSSQSGSAFVTAETVVLTLPSVTYEANRAFQVTTHGGVAQSVNGGFGDLRLKKTNTGGQTLTEFYRYPCPVLGTVYAAPGVAHFITGNNAVTAALVLTLQCGAGTVQHFGTAGSARDVVIEDIGEDILIPGAVTLT